MSESGVCICQVPALCICSISWWYTIVCEARPNILQAQRGSWGYRVKRTARLGLADVIGIHA